jgi:hypothetical protein
MKKVPQGQRREADVTAVVSTGSGRAHCELTPWQRKRGSLKDAKQLAPWSVGSRKVGPINGETIDDFLVNHIFLWRSQVYGIPISSSTTGKFRPR